MFAALALRTGIPPSQLLAEDDIYLKLMIKLLEEEYDKTQRDS